MDRLITITGNNTYTCRQELNSLQAAFIKEHGEFGIEQIDCREKTFAYIKEAFLSPGLLSDSKLLILTEVSFNKELIENFDELLAGLPESTQIIVFDQSIDKRTSFYKSLKKQGKFNEFLMADKAGLINWTVEYVKTNDGKADRNTLVYLIERVGSDQQLLKNELDKLILYSAEISRDSIDLLTVASPQSSIFDLIDAAFAGNLEKANKLYDEQRALKIEPQNIMAMITWQLHILALIKTAGARNANDIAKEAKISPFTVSKSESIAKKMTFEKLKNLINDLAELDYRSKTKTLDLDEGLKNYLVKLSAE